jgi:hypothetical protein
MPLRERATEELLKRDQAPVHGGLVYAQCLRSRKRAPLARDRQEVSKVVPIQ